MSGREAPVNPARVKNFSILEIGRTHVPFGCRLSIEAVSEEPSPHLDLLRAQLMAAPEMEDILREMVSGDPYNDATIEIAQKKARALLARIDAANPADAPAVCPACDGGAYKWTSFGLRVLAHFPDAVFTCHKCGGRG